MQRFTESMEESLSVQDNKLVMNSTDMRRRGVERFYPNEYYGIDLIIKYLLDIDANMSLPFALPHAVCFGYQEGWYVYGKREKVKTLIYHNDLDLRAMRKRGCKGWIAEMESTFSLLLKVLLNSNMIDFFSSPNKRRLLYFPVHSNSVWMLKNKNYDQQLIELLRQKLDEYEVIDVMLPLESIIAGRGATFQEAGFKVISAGSIWDPKFLCRWINLVSTYGSISTSHIGSHLFYCLLMQRDVFWLSSDNLTSPRKIDINGKLRPAMEPFPETLELLDGLNRATTKLSFDSKFWFGTTPERDLSNSVDILQKIYKRSFGYNLLPFRPTLRNLFLTLK